MADQSDVGKHTSKFLDQVLQAPWGSLAKSEIEFLIFELLVDSGRVELSRSDHVIAGSLRTTRARVRNLRYRREQRLSGELTVETLVGAITSRKLAGGSQVLVQITNQYLMDWLVDELQTRKFIARRQLTPDLLEVDVVELIVALGDLGAFTPPESTDLSSELGRILALQKRERRASRVKELLSSGAQVDGIVSLAQSLVSALPD